MAQRFSSTGLFGIFGRSGDLRQLDEALRSVDVHPKLVPEAVKLTAVKLVKEHAVGEPEPRLYRAAAEILAYCMVGEEAFAGANDDLLAQQVEGRIEAALESVDGLDAKLLLLALHAKVIQPSVAYRFQLETANDN